MKTLIVIAAALALAGTASAATPKFHNGNLVAAHLERHLNGAGYKRRIAKVHLRETRRVLCAFDGFYEVKCTGHVVGTVNGVRLSLNVTWDLLPRTAKRAELDYSFVAVNHGGVMDADSQIVQPKEIGLTRF